MLKKIDVDELKIGMHIHELCGSWLDNPFWKKSFTVEDSRQLKLIQGSGIREVWIDSSRGRDIERLVDLTPVTLDSGRLYEEIKESRLAGVVTRKLGFAEELEQARHIHNRSRGVINGLYAEGRMNVPLNLKEADRVVDEVTLSVIRNPDALVSLLHLKPPNGYFYMHALSVCALMVALGHQLEFDDSLLRRLGLAGLLLDMGKALLPESITRKESVLTAEEIALVRMHPQLGHDLLVKSGVTDDIVLDVCLHHHERCDGQGYPDKLCGGACSSYAAMGAVCDVYDALTSDRGYKIGWQPNLAIRKMAEWQDGQFDRTIFHAFVRTVGLYPSGTLVHLKSGRLAKVLEQNDRNLVAPVVKVFFSIRQNAFVEPEILDLGKVKDVVIRAEDPAKWGWKRLPV